MPDIDTLAATVRAGLDAEEVVAQAATWSDEAARWHVWRGKERYENPFVIMDSLNDGVTAVSAESSDTAGVAEHIARQDPATTLARVVRDRRLLDLLLADKHTQCDDPGYNCAALGWTAKGNTGEPCDCGRDNRVTAALTVLAEFYTQEA